MRLLSDNRNVLCLDCSVGCRGVFMCQTWKVALKSIHFNVLQITSNQEKQINHWQYVNS